MTALQIIPKKKSPWYEKKGKRTEFLFLTLVLRDVKKLVEQKTLKRKRNPIFIQMLKLWFFKFTILNLLSVTHIQ